MNPQALACAAVLAALLAGCGRHDIEVYRVAKESTASQEQPQAAGVPPGHPDMSAGTPTLVYKAPAGWQETPAGEMRVASFRVPGKDGKVADVSVIPLPGLAGGDLSNVNRWRGQVGLAPVTEEEMAKLGQAVQMDGVAAQLYDQAGMVAASGENQRILAALLHRDGVVWFFKMTGDQELVAGQKPAFIAFLESVKFAAPAAASATELPPSHPPIGGGPPALASQPAAVPSAGGDKPAWQVPTGWKEVPGGQFLVAKFTLTGENNAQAAVNVSASAGDGGGLAGNLNRWRGQLGLAPLGDADLKQAVTEVEVPGGKALVAEMSGTDARTSQKARLVGAVVARGDQTWFFKLMGDPAVVEREKGPFNTFLKSVKFPGGAQ